MIDSKEVINRAIEFVKEKTSPQKIYLFGSYAKGTQTKDSDLDFLIIEDTNLPRHKRTVPLYTLEKTKKIGAHIGIDFIIYTPSEFEKRKNEPNSIVGEVLRSGKLIYAR